MPQSVVRLTCIWALLLAIQCLFLTACGPNWRAAQLPENVTDVLSDKKQLITLTDLRFQSKPQFSNQYTVALFVEIQGTLEPISFMGRLSSAKENEFTAKLLPQGGAVSDLYITVTCSEIQCKKMNLIFHSANGEALASGVVTNQTAQIKITNTDTHNEQTLSAEVSLIQVGESKKFVQILSSTNDLDLPLFDVYGEWIPHSGLVDVSCLALHAQMGLQKGQYCLLAADTLENIQLRWTPVSEKEPMKPEPTSIPEKTTTSTSQLKNTPHCPTRLADEIIKDRSRLRSFGWDDSIQHECRGETKIFQSTFRDQSGYAGYSFEKFISGDSRFSVGNRVFITDKQCESYISRLNDLEKINLISDYYYYISHLRGVEVTLMQMIASIDSLLSRQDTLLNSRECQEAASVAGKQWCENAHNCKEDTNGLSKLIENTRRDLTLLEDLSKKEKEELGRLPVVAPGFGGLPTGDEKTKIVNSYSAMREMIETTNPILQGRFIKTNGYSRDQLEERVRLQLKATSEELRDLLRKAQHYQSCVDHNFAQCSIENVRQFLSHIPMVKQDQHLENVTNQTELREALVAAAVNQSRSCDLRRAEQNQHGAVIKEVAITVGLALASGSIGPVIRGALVARYAQYINLGVKSLQFVGVARVGGRALNTFQQCLSQIQDTRPLLPIAQPSVEHSVEQNQCHEPEIISQRTDVETECIQDLIRTGTGLGLLLRAR